MWFGEPHPFPERGSPARLRASGQQSYEGWSCRVLSPIPEGNKLERPRITFYQDLWRTKNRNIFLLFVRRKCWYSVVSLGRCSLFPSRIGLRTYQHAGTWAGCWCFRCRNVTCSYNLQKKMTSDSREANASFPHDGTEKIKNCKNILTKQYRKATTKYWQKKCFETPHHEDGGKVR